MHIDSFGNLITDLHRDDVGESDFVLEVLDQVVAKGCTYAEADGTAAIVGSAGYVEIAFTNGSAAKELGAVIGTSVVLRSL